MVGKNKSTEKPKTMKKDSEPEIHTQTEFSVDIDIGKYDRLVLDTLFTHYCYLVFKYVPAKSLGQTRVHLTQDILAHFIMVHACACVLSAERTADGTYAGHKPGFGDSLSSGDDYAMALDSDKFPDYPMFEAEKLLGEDIKQGYTSEEKLRADIEKIIPKDPKLIMIWDIGIQNAAKSHGEFKKMLDAAMKSDDLKKMPNVIAGLNKTHIGELLHPFRMGKLCPNCGWDLPCVGGITTLATCGDEIDYRYFQCENDGKYFVSQLHDKFDSGVSDDSEGFYEIKPEDAKAALDSIKKCPKPDDKHCKCVVHNKYSG